MFVTMSYLTIKQIRIWRNNIDLWTYVIENAPSSGTLAYYKRGKAYEAIGQPEQQARKPRLYMIIAPTDFLVLSSLTPAE